MQAAVSSFREEPVTFRTEKIFIGNVSPSATRSELLEHFSAYGRVLDCVIMTRHDGSGRGFGFCEFADAESVEAVMYHWKLHYLSGQWVEVKRASPENALKKFRAAERTL